MLPLPSTSVCGSRKRVSGCSVSPNFNAYAIASVSGLQGTGTTSSGVKMPDCATMRRRISLTVRRFFAASYASQRPASCTGCSVTPLGSMRYFPMASADFAAAHVAGPDNLRTAAVVQFDRKDSLQNLFLQSVFGDEFRRGQVRPPALSVRLTVTLFTV